MYCVAVFPFFYKDIMAFSVGSYFSFAGIRNAMIQSVWETGKAFSSVITGSAVYIAINVTLIAYIQHMKGGRFFYLSLVLTLAYCILTTGRTGIMALICGLLAIYMIKQKQIRFAHALLHIGLPSLIVIVLLVIYKAIFFGHDESELSEQAFLYFFSYLIGSIPALDSVIYSNNYGQSNHLFQPIAEIINYVFGTSYTNQYTLGFVQVPFWTNVYTAYIFFLQDFGFTGVCIAFFIIGGVYGFVYRAAIKGSKYGIFYYAILIFPLIMVFFSDLFSNIRGHIRDTIFIVTTYFILPQLLFGLRRSVSKLKASTTLKLLYCFYVVCPAVMGSLFSSWG